MIKTHTKHYQLNIESRDSNHRDLRAVTGVLINKHKTYCQVQAGGHMNY